jgi:DNA-directed RNA polymerase specialized sigma24 family protein
VEEPNLAEVVGSEPTPDFAAEAAEEYQRLLNLLDDPELVAVAQAKLEGYTNEEIASRRGCVAQTVTRKLRLIRSIWEKEMAP